MVILLCIDMSPVVIVVGTGPGLVQQLKLKQTFEILFDQKKTYDLLQFSNITRAISRDSSADRR
ncbi:hypothetical protein SDC9_109144 [bioreactor metagenome]|uniref:Uncharacterized protein n=1 Tax=bioreactor metagenome TaxID=1076179 RepID=A0A645BB45_9ZZZZ